MSSFGGAIIREASNMEMLSIAVGLMSIVLGFFSIALAVHFYGKAKDAEKETAVALASIRTQGDALQKAELRSQ